MQSIPWWAQFWKPSKSRILLSKFWCKHMPPNFGTKVILFQISYLSVYHATTIMLRDIRASPYFSGRVLYNVPTVPLPIHSSFFPFFLFLEQTLTTDVVIAKASNPSKPSVLSSRHPSDLRQIQTYFSYNGDHRPHPWGMPPSFYSPRISRHLVFLSFSNLFCPISRKWEMKSWFHQLLLLISIFLGLWANLIHLISSIKKPTKSLSNSLQ